jgi:uncharacterized protein
MAHVRPEFYYHPAVGVVAPASLGLVAFKSGPFRLYNPLISAYDDPFQRRKPEAGTVMMATTSATALASAENTAENTVKNIDLGEIANMDVIRSAPSLPDIRHETCIVTNKDYPYTEVICFAIDPEGNAVPDLNEKLKGDGYFVRATRDVLKRAVWRNSFTTAARTPVNVPKNLPDIVSLALLRQSLDTIGLARKAGLVTQGYAKVEEVLQAGRAALYIVASDARENGREKLERLADAHHEDLPVLDLWTSSQLSAALGEDNAVHIVFEAGGLTEKLLIIAQKLKDIR